MELYEYIKKRDFNTTPEPEAKLGKNTKYRFVVQRHAARRLHYDLRLEIKGVLKSWAVPKGPSMNPNDKRLAIQTEDHPVKYLDFHGTIPKGNYGAGEMSIWDEGTFTGIDHTEENGLIKELENGRLKVALSGKKLKGKFSLVRTGMGEKNSNWLLIKMKDEFSTDLKYDAESLTSLEKIPEPYSKGRVVDFNPKKVIMPMLATSVKEVFDDPEWIYELKWDGYRIISYVNDGEVNLYSRNGILMNSKFPSIVRDLENIEHNTILDGEVVVVDRHGIPDFQQLQNFDEQTASGQLLYYVFDLLYLNEHSTIELPLVDRKSLIPEVLENAEFSKYCDHIEAKGSQFFKKAIEEGMEGVIAKRADSLYTPGYRTDKWLKIKAQNSQEAIICGYTESSGDTMFGSLILGINKDGALTYVGNCGTGFSNEEQKTLFKKMEPLALNKSPFNKKINLKGRVPHWVKPVLICEVKFSEWTKQQIMRHPVYKGIRKDKTSSEIHKETVIGHPKETKSTNSSSHMEINGDIVPVSNLGKVYWPESGFRKYDLIEYYIQVSNEIIPYIKDRPQNLHRHPNGIGKKGFYQKDNDHLPEWVETVNIYSESSNKDIEYLVCQKLSTLVYMANLGCIEINPWNSRIDNLNNPDYAVIDIDPSKENTFEEVIEVAQAAKELLDSIQVKGYCKTSGSTGLHIYLPLGAKYTYDEARDFTKLLCYYIHDRLPKLTSMERAVKNRKGKIYLDYLQNRRGQTLAAPYCVRPKKDAPVSAPIKWKELKKGLKISDFNIQNMSDRINKHGDLFKDVLGEGIEMEQVLDKLNKK